ncbi:MAG: sugar phosphate isomerase/epimerase [Pseudomonadaceae bacterium]|nr:sugar phosphate isomerase/epimerase [Pseudomonadaceae bacterium]
MNHPLSLAAGVLPEFEPSQVARAAVAAGYDMAGFTIDPDNWSGAHLSRLKSQLADEPIDVLDVEVVWLPAGGAVTDAHRLILDVGAEVNAANVLVVTSEPDVNRNAEALHRLCELAAPAGMRVVLEFLMITEVRSLASAAEIVRRADHPAAGILIDSLHLQRSGESARDVAAIDPTWLPYSQVCDGNLACEDFLVDAIDLRCAVGEGELPLGDLMSVLDPKLPLSLEVRSKRYRDEFPDASDRAGAMLTRTRAGLAALARD